MKKITLVIFAVLVSQSGFAQSGKAGPLSEEELTPFCNNKDIWASFNVSADRCLPAAKACSDKIAKMNLDWAKATEELYSCVFKELNIDIPSD